MSGSSGYILVIVIGVIVLAGLTFMNLRKISKSTADLTQLKKRTLLWSEISLALFVLQLFFRDRQGGFLLFFGILTLLQGLTTLVYCIIRKKGVNNKWRGFPK